MAKQNPLDRCEKDPGADPEHNMCSAETEIGRFDVLILKHEKLQF